MHTVATSPDVVDVVALPSEHPHHPHHHHTPAKQHADHAVASTTNNNNSSSNEAEHYFRSTPLASQSSSVSTTNSRSPPPKPLTLYFSGKDLPEPDSRSRASYAVVYIARETPLDDTAASLADPSSSSSNQQRLHLSRLTHDSADSLPHHARRVDTHTSSRSADPAPSRDAARPSPILANTRLHQHPQQRHGDPRARTDSTQRDSAPLANASAPSSPVRRQKHSSTPLPPAPPLARRKHASSPPLDSPQKLLPPMRSASRASTRSHDVPSRALSAPLRGPPLPSALVPPTRSATAPRAPDRAVSNFAPPQPTVHVDRHGARVRRTAWTKVGSTEVARKQGRDVEFSRGFRLDYSPAHRLVVRLAFFDCTSAKVDRQRLIGTSEFYLSAAFAANSRPVSFPLKFLPITKNDYRRSARIPNGTLVVVADHVLGQAKKYRLDVECNRILRSASLSTVTVRRVFYTIHAILDDEETSDVWTLIFRSVSVQMIHKKRDGGSLEYNYFSSRRLRAAPGVILEEQVTKGQDQDVGLRATVAKALGFRRKDCFFSLPGADIQLAKPEMRLKLSLFEDNGLAAGYHLIADTCFSIADLKMRELGESSAIKVHANVVGRAQLKYVEIAPDPRYFCLALCMQGIR